MVGTVVITGPNGGMTIITAQQYAKAHPEDHLVLLVRNPSSLPSGAVPASDKVSYEAFDMTNLSAVRSAASSISAKISSGALPRIKSLVCSAAIQVTSPDQPRVTGDGYEETVAVNHLAHFALILDFLPSMTPDGQIVIVGSASHSGNYKFFPKKAVYKPLRELLSVQAGSEPAAEARDNGWQRYGTSKLMQMMIGHELARRLKTHPTYSHINVVMFDPGSMGGTGLLRDLPYINQVIFGVMFKFYNVMNWLDPALDVSPKENSAATLLKIVQDRKWASAEPLGQAKEDGGAPYYSPRGELVQTLGEANEPAKAKELWKNSAESLGMDKEKALGG